MPGERTCTQKLFMRLMPRWAEDMEREAKEWKVVCPRCSHIRSIWELGGIRWKAKGNPRRRLRCPECGETGWHRIERESEPTPAS
jgi:DNA-directed RNA polymerase subunit RPC12/RpoP